jgi:polysaccharide export outer membrane protein
MKRFLFAAVICVTLMLNFSAPVACFGAEELSTSVSRASAEDPHDSYRIGSGDFLEITTWKEEDFSRDDILVRLDGKISFPLLNDVQAAGLTPLELKENIESGLKEYVAAPVVTVHVKSPSSQKFYILGEVMRTGEYQLVKNLTVLQAFALAGGFTEWASKKEIILLRQVGGQNKTIRVNYKDIEKGKNFSQNVMIKANDTIIVP